MQSFRLYYKIEMKKQLQQEKDYLELALNGYFNKMASGQSYIKNKTLAKERKTSRNLSVQQVRLYCFSKPSQKRIDKHIRNTHNALPNSTSRTSKSISRIKKQQLDFFLDTQGAFDNTNSKHFYLQCDPKKRSG